MFAVVYGADNVCHATWCCQCLQCYMVLSMIAMLHSPVIVCSATWWSQCVQFHRVLLMNAVPDSSVNVCSDTKCFHVFSSKKSCRSLQCLFCFQCFHFDIMLSVSSVGTVLLLVNKGVPAACCIHRERNWNRCIFNTHLQLMLYTFTINVYSVLGQVPANNSLLEV